jgi:Organic solute transporter Ostalpha
MIYQLAGTFTVLSCLISMWHMTAHLRKLNQPDVQRKILAILWMSPVYAITSWFSLVFRSAEGYLAILKDFYEAYTIYQFLSFCIAVLGKGDRNVVVDLLAQHVEHLTPPFRLFGCFEVICCGRCCKGPTYESNRQLANAILLQCQLFAMQFVFFRPLTTTAIVALEKLNYYGAGDGPKDYRSPQFYITIVQNISIFVAFTGLLKFYHAVDKDLAWCRPFAKFLCIKGVVFMTFWQGLALSVLAQTTDVAGEDDADAFAKSSQNFLICLEMLLFSIAHFYCFPTEEWEDGYRVKHAGGSFSDSIAFGDFMSDLKLLIKSNGKKGQKKIVSQETIPESELVRDELNPTDTQSIATSQETNDDVHIDEHEIVAEALQKSLGTISDDPEIAEAKRRLLESKVLNPAFFDYDESDDGNGFMDDDLRAEVHRRLEMDDYDNIDSIVEHGLTASAHENGGTTAAYDVDCVTESTSLLGSNRIGSASPLRPSIFTTVASIAENGPDTPVK